MANIESTMNMLYELAKAESLACLKNGDYKDFIRVAEIKSDRRSLKLTIEYTRNGADWQDVDA